MRECLVVAAAVWSAGCSLVLDFSDNKIPADAAIDAPYTDDECTYKEPNESIDMAAVIAATDTGPAAICAATPEDHDFYKFTMPAATTTATIKIMFTNRPGGDLDLRLWDPAAPANPIGQSRGFGDDETLVCPGASPSCPALTPGSDYVLEVLPGVAGNVNAYTFSVAFQ